MKKSLVIAVVLAAALTVGYFFLPKNVTVQANDLTKTDVEEIVRNFILDNPEVIIESMNNYRTKQEQQAQAKAAEALSSIDVKGNKNVPTIGNPNGDVTVLEFFDYNCGYCKHVYPTLAQLIKEDSNVTVKMMEFPILSQESQLAAQAGMAVWMIAPDKYFAFHGKLMEFKGNKSKDIIMSFVRELGMDEAAVSAKMDSTEVNGELANIRAMAQQINISGTPAFVIGKQLIPGAVDINTLKAAIADARRGDAKPAEAAPAEAAPAQ